MNKMNQAPPNMTRVLLLDDDGIFEFAFYKDGMYQDEVANEWYSPHCIEHYEGWISISALKLKLDV